MAFNVIKYIRRLYLSLISPPSVPKSSDAVRFGILGAANIAPQALITPARSHADVVIAAVAARDPKKAEAFAKKHGIPIVHKTYEDLLTDPSIDCIYIPLPNGLHYEWAIKALEARKNVLLEKPSVSNASEAHSLFNHPILNEPNAPVLLEAFHYRFHPAWSTFLAQFNSEDVEQFEAKNSLLAGVFPKNDIRFLYDLAGGALMDYGSYALHSMRMVFGSEPTTVKSASARLMPDGFDKQCDEAMLATYEFPNSGTAAVSVDLQARGGYWFPAITKNWPSLKNLLPTIRMKLREEKEGVENGLEKYTQKNIVMVNYIGPHLYHRIDVTTCTTWRDQKSGDVVKIEKKVDCVKAYKWREDSDILGGREKRGEEWWPTYRYQLEEFVNRVKKREGSGAWVPHEDSIRQSELLDRTYEKAGLPIRPTSKALVKM